MSLLKTTGWLFPLALLAGCDAAVHSAAQKPPQGVSLPALPIIEGAVAGLVPMIDGQRNDLMMRQVCALARGESSAAQVAQTLQQQGINLSNVAPQGHPLSLLVDPDAARRATACAAYIATSVMTLPKTSEFMVPAKADQTAGKHAQTMSIDPQKLNNYLRVQLAVAKADADLFALIATQLEQTPGLTLEQYNQRAQNLFSSIAPAYLQRVKELYANGQNTQYSLKEYSDNRFAFTASSGHLFEYGYDGLNLSFNRIVWYGAGQLLGRSYRLEVAYFDPALMALLKDRAGSGAAIKSNP
ncbi:hypothetical protein [Pseudomonas sp. L1(2025)]|uniref:hypothetical protein n=1 Tax=Pseudomonas sp. L1(2025) TaxID=3449429 RepID=UPI003F68EAF6